MTVHEIYQQFMIPQNLQEHMLRVAGVAQIIADSWTGDKLSKQAIIQAALFHDIAKPITFDLSKQAIYGMTDQEIDSLARLQKRIKQEYGKNEHQAVLAIGQEIGVSSEAIKMLNHLEWENIHALVSSEDYQLAIPLYCDMRIGPKGVLSLEERFVDLQQRTGQIVIQCLGDAIALEKWLNQHTALDITNISNEDLEARFSSLELKDI